MLKSFIDSVELALSAVKLEKQKLFSKFVEWKIFGESHDLTTHGTKLNTLSKKIIWPKYLFKITLHYCFKVSNILVKPRNNGGANWKGRNRNVRSSEYVRADIVKLCDAASQGAVKFWNIKGVGNRKRLGNTVLEDRFKTAFVARLYDSEVEYVIKSRGNGVSLPQLTEVATAKEVEKSAADSTFARISHLH